MEFAKRETLGLPFIAACNIRGQFSLPGKPAAGFDGDVLNWVEEASDRDVEKACLDLIPLLPQCAFVHHLRVERKARVNVVKAQFAPFSLIDALHWMVWQDVFHEHPFQFCEECRKLFQPDWQHAKKYCSPECAHRKTAREWQQRKREKQRRTNVTHKAS
jgi:hypothetical protein